MEPPEAGVIDPFCGSGGFSNAGGRLGATDLHAITVRPDCLQRRWHASTTTPRSRNSFTRGVISFIGKRVISVSSLFVAFGTPLKATNTCFNKCGDK